MIDNMVIPFYDEVPLGQFAGAPVNVEGKPLKAAMIRGYLQELEPGESTARKALFDRVCKTHVERGGLPSEAKSPMDQFDMQLKEMKEQGFLANPETGIWERTDKQPRDEDSAIEELASQAQVTMGEGRELVYAWNLPLYRRWAETQGESVYPMKIGITGNDDPQIRITTSEGYAPEQHELGFLFRTDDAQRWEKLLHSFLGLCGRHKPKARGTEWYDTTPDELREIVSRFEALIDCVSKFRAECLDQ
jgi:hypothetical protein